MTTRSVSAMRNDVAFWGLYAKVFSEYAIRMLRNEGMTYNGARKAVAMAVEFSMEGIVGMPASIRTMKLAIDYMRGSLMGTVLGLGGTKRSMSYAKSCISDLDSEVLATTVRLYRDNG